MGYEHREDAVGCRGSMQYQTQTHKRTHSVPCDTQGGWNLGQGSDALLTHVSVAAPLIKLMGNDHRENALGRVASRQGQTHTHTHSVPRDTQGGWSLGQGSDGILTHESVAHPQIKSMVSEHREYVVGGGGSRQYQTHTHTQCPK